MTKPTGDSRALKTFAKLDKEERVLEAKLEKVKAARKEAEPAVLQYFERMGMDRASIDGVTIYVKRDVWAGRAEGISALELKAHFDDAGLSEYCEPRLNHQSFSAFVREIEKQNLGEGRKSIPPADLLLLLPPELQPAVKITETFKINTRKSS